MGTRIFYENFTKNTFPNIKVRVCQDKNEPWIANFYLEDQQGNFSEYVKEKVIPKLESVREIGTKFNFKPYSDLKADNIPSEPSLPDNIRTLALNPDNTIDGVRLKF